MKSIQFNDWTALSKCRTSDDREGYYCRCKCGTKSVVRKYYLETGKSRNCGCVRKETLTTKSHGMSKSPIYVCWLNMRARCYSDSHVQYKDYGGRGISVSPEWDHFEVFSGWAFSNGYTDGLMIERVDNDGNYEPGNCKFSTRVEQMNNRRSNALVTIDGVTKTKAEWSRHYGITYMEFWKQHKRGDYN